MSAAPRVSAAGCSNAAPLLWAAFDSFATTAAAPSAAAAAADCVQDNSLYRLSALAGTRTRAHTIGTSQPALTS